jgi:hypothetical protein
MGETLESDFFSASAIPGDISTETLLIILAAFVFLVVLALVLLCLCRTRSPVPVDPSMLVTYPAVPPSGSTVENLIPPLFYTEDLRDPLMQEDLRDRVIALRANDAARTP